jgi:hypothetical protein
MARTEVERKSERRHIKELRRRQKCGPPPIPYLFSEDISGIFFTVNMNDFESLVLNPFTNQISHAVQYDEQLWMSYYETI